MLSLLCIQYPYPKKSMTDDDQEMDSIEQEFHASYKPNWGPRALLLYAIPGKVNLSRNTPSRTDPILNNQKGVIVSEGKDIRFAKFTAPLQVSALCFPVSYIASTLTNQLSSLRQTHSNTNALTH